MAEDCSCIWATTPLDTQLVISWDSECNAHGLHTEWYRRRREPASTEPFTQKGPSKWTRRWEKASVAVVRPNEYTSWRPRIERTVFATAFNWWVFHITVER